MARIDPRLLKKIMTELNIGRSRAYEVISDKANETWLDPRLAAVIVARDHGINIRNYTTAEDLAELRDHFKISGSSTKTNDIPRTEIVVKDMDPLTVNLSSISDSDLRSILSRDVSELSEIRTLGLKGTCKSCMILCGSIAESLLLDALMQKEKHALAVAKTLPRKYDKDLKKWVLGNMVEVATSMNPPLLPEDALKQADVLRDWRNLIHPGRELRDSASKGVKPTAHRARNAIAFLQFIAEELSERS